jgi:hypothetical protein
MKPLLTITLLFICSLAFGQATTADRPRTSAKVVPSPFKDTKWHVINDTTKIKLTEDDLALLDQLNKEGQELQKDAAWILINTKLQSVQQKQLAFLTGVQHGLEIKGSIVSIKDGYLIIVK